MFVRLFQVSSSSPLFALDCEFVLVQGNEFAPVIISIVNEAGEVVYHTLIKPQVQVTDYLTKFSSMNKSSLSGVTTTLADVHAAIRANLPPDAILVGHSLDSDLLNLKVI